MCVKVVVPAAKLRFRLRKNRFIIIRAFERRLICGGPELSARHVAEVTERAPVIAGAVFAPACYCDVLPAAVTAPAFVIITWYLPLDNNCTSGIGVSGLLKTRTGVSVPLGSAYVCRRARRYANKTLWPLAPAPGAAAWSPGTPAPPRIASASDGPGADRPERGSSFQRDVP